MPKILCTIPGAPTTIGGLHGDIEFEPVDGGVMADVADDEAARFATIPGYVLVDARAPLAPELQAELDALKARAAAAGLTVDKRWKLERLKSEVEHAEALKAEAEKKAAEGGTPNT